MITPIYNEKFNDIILNLDLLKNNYLINALKNNKINPNHIAFLSPKDIDPEKWDIYIQKLKYKKMKEDKIEFNTNYKCSNCGNYKSRVHQVQMRN